MTLEPTARAAVVSRLDYLRANGGALVIDGDVHPTDREAVSAEMAARLAADPGYFHGRPLLADTLLDLMDRAGVDMALCWHNPAVLAYGEDKAENARRLTEANERIASLAAAHPTRVIPGGWTDPKALGVENAIALARHCVQVLGMPIVKMNPAQNGYPIDDPMVFAVVDVIVGMGAVPAFHFGSDTPFTPPEGLRQVTARYPRHPVIAVHMGGGGGHFIEAEPVYQAARQLGLQHPNIFYILSAIREPHIESALIAYAAAGEPYRRNLAIGSDAPYGNMTWTLGGFRALVAELKNEGYPDPRLRAQPELFTEATVRGFSGSNLADLVIAASGRILERSAGIL